MRVGIQPTEQSFAGTGVRLKEKDDEKVAKVVGQLYAVRDGQGDEKGVGRRLCLPPSKYQDAEDVASQAEDAECWIEDEACDELRQGVEVLIAFVNWRPCRGFHGSGGRL